MTNETQNPATEETGSVPVAGASEDKEIRSKSRAFLSSAMRDLSEDELNNPAARRFLIAEIERLDREMEDYRSMSGRYNDLRVDHAALKARFASNRWLEVLAFVAASVGSAGLGAAPSYINAPHLAAIGWIFVIGSAILVLAGVIFRIAK